MTALRLRRDGVACSDLGSEVVILDFESSTYFSARASAAVIVQTLVEGASPEALVAKLLDRYDVTTDVAAADVRRFLDQLESRNLLEQIPARGVEDVEQAVRR
jgi:Coenzyme PQQ synthesis protein D (PqqD)